MTRTLTNEDFLTGVRCLRRLWYRKNGADVEAGSLKTPLYVAYEQHQQERLSALCGEGEQGDEHGSEAARAAQAADDGCGGPAVTVSTMELSDGWVARAHADRVWKTDSGCGASILRPVTSVKKTIVWEAAFIRHVLEASGVRVSEISVRYLSKAYRRTTGDDYAGLVTEAELTKRIGALGDAVPRRLETMVETLALPETELTKRVAPCGRRNCPICSSIISPEKRLAEVERKGELSREKRIQLEVSRSGTPYLDQDAVRSFLEALEYPLFFLDFEAYSEAVPSVEGVSPWEHIPVIYSLHKVEHRGAEPTHVAYAANPRDDERSALFSHLAARLGQAGSVVVYGKSFERRMIERLAGTGFGKRAEEIVERLVDLSSVFAGCHYCRPEQRGSASLKAVYSAVAGRDYDGLFISDGREANVYYYFLRHGFPANYDASPSSMLEELKAYCSQDTEAMVRIIEHLYEVV